MVSAVRKILWDFHYNSSYGPARAERDLDRAYAVKRAKPIRWVLKSKIRDGRKWWRGYIAGKFIWEIWYDKHWYRLYDQTDSRIFLTEKQNGMGFSHLDQAKETAQFYFDKFYIRATR